MGVGGAQRSGDGLQVHCPQPFKRPERVDLAQRLFRITGHGNEIGDGTQIPAVDDELLRRITAPAVFIRKIGNKLHRLLS